MMETLLFKAALAAYLASAFVYGGSLLKRRVLTARFGAGLMLVALGIHTFYYLFRWIGEVDIPSVDVYDTLSFFAWAMAASYLAMQLRTKTRVLGAFVAPVISVLMIVASIDLGGSVVGSSALKGTLVIIHVMLSVAGEALFAVASLAGIMYLIQDRLLRKKRDRSLIHLFPSLHDLDRINYICLFWGFSLLTLGILAGSFWARIAWGSHWQWDPKQVWTLLAWGFYAFLLHQRLAIGWQGRKAARWSLMAFFALLLLFVLESFLFRSAHTFM
ncbi:MAG: cytochrome c biogenesis protein CcsA [Syntrophales bacterium]